MILPNTELLCNTATLLLAILVTTKSTLPSPFISPIAIASAAPKFKCCSAVKPICPTVDILRNTDTSPSIERATAKSDFSSPSKSPIAISAGPLPVVKLAAMEKFKVPSDKELFCTIDTVLSP